jgi:DNA polymerase
MTTRSARLGAVAAEAQGCTACELYAEATQTVFGAGPVDAPLLLVGEQPGDVEDRTGEPFVGPAGRLLWEALDEAGISSEQVYVTNAVKHFRWEPRGKRRIHRTPGTEHVRACHRWIEAELEIVEPDVLVLLGATATKALAPDLRVMRDRGVLHQRGDGPPTLVTVHPSAVLRSDDRDEARAQLVHDLAVARAAVGRLGRHDRRASGGRVRPDGSSSAS